MAIINVLRAFQVISQDGEKIISATYNQADEAGNIVKRNAKDSFYAIDPELKAHIDAIEDYINRIRFGQEE